MGSVFFSRTSHIRVRLLKRYGITAREGCTRHQEGSDILQRKFITDVQNVTCYRYLQAACFTCLQPGASSKLFEPAHSVVGASQFRYKTKKASRSSTQNDGNDSDGSEDEDQEESTDSKVLKGRVSSVRIDTVLKFALGMSRNKVENAFYSNSIYLNGEKLDKKKHSVAMEDEVDVVREQNSLNPAFIDVQRVEVLDIQHSPDPDKLAIKVRRFKRLTIDNYASPWKPAASE